MKDRRKRNWFNTGKTIFRLPVFTHDTPKVKEIYIIDVEHGDYLYMNQNEQNIYYWAEEKQYIYVLTDDKNGWGIKPSNQNINYWVGEGYVYPSYVSNEAITLSKSKKKTQNHCAFMVR